MQEKPEDSGDTCLSKRNVFAGQWNGDEWPAATDISPTGVVEWPLPEEGPSQRWCSAEPRDPTAHMGGGKGACGCMMCSTIRPKSDRPRSLPSTATDASPTVRRCSRSTSWPTLWSALDSIATTAWRSSRKTGWSLSSCTSPLPKWGWCLSRSITSWPRQSGPISSRTPK